MVFSTILYSLIVKTKYSQQWFRSGRAKFRICSGILEADSCQKNAIANYASQHFVAHGQIIILEAGTSAMAMVKYLQQRNLTLITNGLGTLNELSANLMKVEVMSCSGVLRDLPNTFVGHQAEQFFTSVKAHKLFLGATGIMLDDGISDPNVLEIQVKQAMAACADEVILLLDSSKFGVRSLKTILL